MGCARPSLDKNKDNILGYSERNLRTLQSLRCTLVVRSVYVMKKVEKVHKSTRSWHDAKF